MRSRRVSLEPRGIQPNANAAALNEQHAFETATTDGPQFNGVPDRKVNERLYMTLRQS
jgi:hypothetical protein